MKDPEIKVKPLLWTALGAVTVLALAAAVAFTLLARWHLAPGGPSGSAAVLRTIPAPRLQTAPQAGRAWPASAPAAALEFGQRLGAALPTALRLQDADGHPVDRQALLAGGKPIVLLPAWYRCDTLCGTTAHGTLEALADTGLPPDAWRLVLFSIDPGDQAPDARALQTVYRDYAAWSRPTVFEHVPPDLRLLTGSAVATRALAHAIGFDWAAEPAVSPGGASGYAHAAGLVVLTPNGVVSRYLFGVRFDPLALRSALVEASDGRVGGLADRLLLACSHLDPRLGGRDAIVIALMRALGLLVLGALVSGVWLLQRRQKKAQP